MIKSFRLSFCRAFKDIWFFVVCKILFLILFTS